jgi:uncharacterized cupredoxin-like copper-binding protein
MNRIRLAFVAVLVLLAVVAPAAARTHSVSTTTKVTVKMTEFKFVLSKKSVPHGKIIFKLVNKGKLAHDFAIGTKKSKHIAPGKTGTLTVTLAKGKHSYKCTIDGHAKAGMKGVLKVT